MILYTDILVYWQVTCSRAMLNYKMNTKLQKLHSLKVTQDDVESRTCHVCGRCLSRKHNMVDHMRLHTGERPYACPSCRYRATQRSNLKKHVKNMHGLEALKMLKF